MAARQFTIADDGDEFEKQWWPQWTRDRFPSYEAFWVKRIVPLTHRVHDRSNIGFQATTDLAAAGFTDEDVAVAQLHYTLLRHLGRTFELLDDARAFTTRGYLANRQFGRDESFEAFARLSGASDVADELLGRRTSPGTYGAWDERQGGKARRNWRDNNPDPLRPIRSYRNRLVHGRIVPELYVRAIGPKGESVGDLFMYPTLGMVDAYLDWRKAFAVAASPTPPPNFAEAAIIAADAWVMVAEYVEQAWRTHLLPSL